MAPGPLVVKLQRLIERTYDLHTGLGDLGPYIIGDEGYARFFEGRPVAQKVGAAAPAGAKTLLRDSGDGLRVCVYYPDRMVENLERLDPARCLSDDNVDDFATLIEELDHFLFIADRHRSDATMSLLELELHANVTKSLVLELFVARIRRRDRLTEPDRDWIQHHLFDKNEFREDDPDVEERYRNASALAVRYLRFFRSLPVGDRPAELRRFHRRSHHEKLAHIARI